MPVCTSTSIVDVSIPTWYIAPPTPVALETVSAYPSVPSKPGVAIIDSGSAPSAYLGGVVNTTTWPIITVDIPAVPDFDLPNVQPVTPSNAPAVVTEDGETTEIEEAIWSGDWTPTTRLVSLPTPPSINLEVPSIDVPEFTVDKPVDDLDWVYNAYSSDLLTTLTTMAASFLTQDLPISSTSIVALCKKLWNTPSNFLAARGIKNLSHRESVMSQRYGDNINRLVDILKAKYRDVNDKNYVKFMQAIENLNRDVYDAKKRGELLYAKEYQQVKLMEYESEIASYNVLLSVYRAQAMRFEADIKAEQAKLEKYQMDIEVFRKEGEVNRQLIAEYLAQIQVVNTIVDSYKLSMEVARAIANITILSTELESLNAQNSVLRSRNLVKLANNEVEFKKVELAMKQILDADVAYGKILLEKEMAELDRLIAISTEDLSGEEHDIEARKANSIRTNVIARVNSFYNLVVSQLNNMELNATEERATKVRVVDKMNLNADISEDRYLTEASIIGDKIRSGINALHYNPRAHYKATLLGDQEIYDAEYAAAELRAEAAVTQTLNHTISSS